MKKIIISLMAISLAASLFMSCQNPSAPSNTAKENTVKLPEEYRKIIGSWINSSDKDYVEQMLKFTETSFASYRSIKEEGLFHKKKIEDIKVVNHNDNTATIKLYVNDSEGMPYVKYFDIIDENSIYYLDMTYTRKTDKPSGDSSSQDTKTSVDASKLYGSWRYTSDDNITSKSGTFTFKEDGVLEFNGDVAKPIENSNYSLSGDNITIKFEVRGNQFEETLKLKQDEDSITLTSSQQISTVLLNYFSITKKNEVTLQKHN